MDESTIRQRYAEARAAGATRHRDIAAQLGLSEGELIAAHQGEHAAGLRAQALQPRWPELLRGLKAVGPVMALTRNAHCVHERDGVYEQVSGEGAVGLVLGPDIDLRLFYAQWQHGFAVEELGPRGLQRSLQFFDAQGQAVHKVFARAGRSDEAVWAALVRGLAASASTRLNPRPPEPSVAERPDHEIDTAALHADWAALRDTHEFHGLLRRQGLRRTQALRLAEPRFVQALDSGAARALLRAAAGAGTPLMVFVGNPGCIQIHTGAVRRVEVIGPWLNVLDPVFNLHLREDAIDQAWLVRKPSSDGLISSLELFDAQGETIAMFFGERKPGRPELGAWRHLLEQVAELPREEAACASC